MTTHPLADHWDDDPNFVSLFDPRHPMQQQIRALSTGCPECSEAWRETQEYSRQFALPPFLCADCAEKRGITVSREPGANGARRIWFIE